MRRKNNFIKILMIGVVITTAGYFYFSLKDLKTIVYGVYNDRIQVNQKRLENVAEVKIIEDKIIEQNSVIEDERPSDEDRPKYILQWTSKSAVPFAYMGQGKEGFTSRNCEYTNCIVTNDRSLLGDYTKFDVIAFNGPEVVRMSEQSLPQKRSPHQKFVFATIESADNYPVCSDRFNNFFNWTWTYRLTSEAKWGYMAIRDENKKVIGPNLNMNWLDFDEMKPVSDEVKEKLRKKTKAVAWFVSNCSSRSRRKDFANRLAAELTKYGLSIDIYGACGPLKCDRGKEEECNEMLERDYYFYLAFENSFCEDYVTEKALWPLIYLTVPIVYGGANYSRFIPDSAYLNARELGEENLARIIKELIDNPDQYEQHFKWTNHYSYHTRGSSRETDDYCRFCSILYDEKLVKTKSVYENFREWWDPPSRC
ncbi:unnamed protein product [Leptosia nina]|uniref:Fucosyltransferase n=1 Tax=Leptosia nina TaxID=320188 RepID=A0AAV1JGZ7_9NEOP